MDKTLKLMDTLFDAAARLSSHAKEMANHYEDALYEHGRLSQEDYFIDRRTEEEDLQDLAAFFETTLDSADDCVAWTLDDLKDFDRTLAKVIELRGKLAEETGIPILGWTISRRPW